MTERNLEVVFMGFEATGWFCFKLTDEQMRLAFVDYAF